VIKNQNYNIIQLGQGKYTKVFCMELEADKKVAVKVLKSAYEKNKFFQDQLIKEARFGLQIKHPGVRKVLDLIHDDSDNTYQVMMEYLDGYNMQDYIDNFGSIPEKQVIDWLRSLLPALMEAHRIGIIHGLLKPGNFILTPRGKLKICDFKGPYFESELFPENVDAEDILYLSPEQIQHIGPVSATSDIYTLGVMIYTLVSGRQPYDAANADVDEVRLRILNEALPFVENVSVKLNSVIQAATAKNPGERYASVESMLSDLDGEVVARQSNIFTRAQQVIDHNRSQSQPVREQTPGPRIDEETVPATMAPAEKIEEKITETTKDELHTPEIVENKTDSRDKETPAKEKSISEPAVPDNKPSKAGKENDMRSETTRSLEDRAQAVWDKIGVAKKEGDPVVDRVPVIQISDAKKKVSGKKEQATKPSSPGPATDKKLPVRTITPDGKTADASKTPEPTPPVVKENVTFSSDSPLAAAVMADEVKLTEEKEKKSSGLFLVSLLLLGAIAGSYFIYDYYKNKKQDVVVTQETVPDSIQQAEEPVAQTIATPVSQADQAKVDSLIESDSSVSLEELEKAKLAKLAEIEAIRKKKEEEAKEKEALKNIDKSKLELLGPYTGDIAPYKYNNLVGFISRDGKVIKKPTYEEILSFSNGLAPVNLNGKWGFVNTAGQETIKPRYNEIFGFSKGLAGVKKDGKWGFISTSGTTVVPFNYDVVTDFAEGLAGVRKNGKWGFVSKNGEEAIPCQFDNAWSFKDGLAGVEKNNKWGFINRSGQSVIPLEYGQVNNFIEGFACVEKNGKYGFINKDGVEVIKCQYEAAKPFKNGTARVFDNGKWIYINKSGKCVRDCN